jgi:hypothetical protein
MTLLLAGIEDSEIWMVSDAAVTGGNIDLRQRQYLPKIEVCQHGTALAGFSGDVEIGAHLIRSAAFAKNHEDAIKFLTDGSRGTSIDFAYGFFESKQPNLLRISEGHSEKLNTFHLGSDDAFEVFQRIRLGEINPYAPLALNTFIFGAPTESPSERLSEAIRCMLDLFVSREEHDVGGWAVPYLLNSDRAYFCQYCYSVSDPLFDKIAPGSIIPHGTQELGGSTLSVTSFDDQDGMVVYWL